MRYSIAIVAVLIVCAGIGVGVAGRTAASAPPLLSNGRFDGSVAGWALGTGSSLNTLTYVSGEDVNGSGASSGGAEVRIGEGPFQPGGSYVETVVQCVPVVGGQAYAGQAFVRIPTANQYASTEANINLFWYPNASCSGGFISNNQADWLGVSNAWQRLSVQATAPPSAQAVRFRLQLDGQDPAGAAQSYAFFDHASLFAPLTGDADCSKDIDAIDAVVVLQLNAGFLTALLCQANGDINTDTTVNSIDALLVLQFVTGLISTLPP